MTIFKRGALASAILLGALALSGCTPAMQAYKAAALDRGAAAYDALLVDNENVMCRVASAGSVARRYWISTAMFDAWMTICYPQLITPPTLPLSVQPPEPPADE